MRVAADGGQKAQSTFKRLACAGGFTLAEVRPHTGRKHQIRAHAAWLGYPVAGDKIYGPDARHFLTFIAAGWTPDLAAALPHPRQLLHAARLSFPGETPDAPDLTLHAPAPADWVAFSASVGLPVPG